MGKYICFEFHPKKQKTATLFNISARINCFVYLQNYPLIAHRKKNAVQFLDDRKPDLQIHVRLKISTGIV